MTHVKALALKASDRPDLHPETRSQMYRCFIWGFETAIEEAASYIDTYSTGMGNAIRALLSKDEQK